MKILYLSSDPGIDLAGQSGGSIHIRALVRALADLGHDVAVVCTSVSGSSRQLEVDLKAAVHPAPLARWNRFLARKIQAANRLLGRTPRHHPDLVRLLHNRRFVRIARAVARELSPDFIYEHHHTGFERAP